VLEYTYRRSTGPVIGAFLTGLRDGKILGAKCVNGDVLVPAAEYDPTGEATGELVEVGQSGVVTTWTWVAAPRKVYPLQKPFAYALIKLDGASTAMLHAVDAPESQMKSGMRVKVQWKPERVGSILDIACFVPVEAA
jgi:hypothetical protein